MFSQVVSDTCWFYSKWAAQRLSRIIGSQYLVRFGCSRDRSKLAYQRYTVDTGEFLSSMCSVQANWSLACWNTLGMSDKAAECQMLCWCCANSPTSSCSQHDNLLAASRSTIRKKLTHLSSWRSWLIEDRMFFSTAMRWPWPEFVTYFKSFYAVPTACRRHNSRVALLSFVDCNVFSFRSFASCSCQTNRSTARNFPDICLVKHQFRFQAKSARLNKNMPWRIQWEFMDVSFCLFFKNRSRYCREFNCRSWV